MATDDDIDRYIACMRKIKMRVEIIKPFLAKTVSTGHPLTDAEFVCLQIRKVLELIALSSLCAHREKYEEVEKEFHTHWKAVKILKKIEKFNPNFYPVPYNEKINPGTGRVGAAEKKTAGFLTRSEFETAMNRCGEFLHSSNPYSFKPVDLEKLRKTCRGWIEQIIELLSTHIIQMVDDRKQLWVMMHLKDTGDVAVAEMERVD